MLVGILATLLLGAGAICLVVGATRTLRARSVEPVSLLWGLAVLLQLAASWWAIAFASGPWPPLALAFLAAAIVALLVASVLVLAMLSRSPGAPARFEESGRWGLLGLAAFNLIALAANREVWYEGVLADAGRVNLVLAIIAIAGFLARGRARMATAAGYLAIFVWDWAGLPTFG